MKARPDILIEPVFGYVLNGLTILWDFERKVRGKVMIFISSLKAVVLNLGGRKGFRPPSPGICGSVGRHFLIVTMGEGGHVIDI